MRRNDTDRAGSERGRLIVLLTACLVMVLLLGGTAFPSDAQALITHAEIQGPFADAANSMAHDMSLGVLDHNADPAGAVTAYGIPQPMSRHYAFLGWTYRFHAMVYPDAATASAALDGMHAYLANSAAASENSAPGVSWVFYKHVAVQRGSFHSQPGVLVHSVGKWAYDADGKSIDFIYSPEQMAELWTDSYLALNGYHLEDVHSYTRVWVQDNVLIYLDLPHVGDDELVYNRFASLGQASMLRGTIRDAESIVMPGVELRLVAEKDGAGLSLATGRADADGFYSFPLVSPPAGSVVKLQVTLRHDWAFSVHSGNPSAPVVIAEVPVPDSFFADGQDHNQHVVFGQSTMTSFQGLSTTRLKEASVVYRNIETALSYAANVLLEPKSVFSRKPLPVYVHAAGNTAYYQPGPAGSSYIAIDTAGSGVNSGDRPMNREWHEFAHYLMDEFYPGGMPASTGSNHGGTANPDSGDSIVEGFAEFYSLLVADMPHYLWAGTKSNLEDNGVANGRTDEEFAVAGLYWDLYDGVEARDGDYVDLDRYTIWDHATAGVTSVRALYNRLKAAGVGQTDSLKTDIAATDLDLLFVEHGFYQDTNKNGRHDGGEAAGWAGAVSGTQRQDKAPRPGGSIRLNLTGDSGAPLATATVVLSYKSPQGNGYYDFTQEIGVTNGQEVFFDLPDVAGATMAFRIKGAPASASEINVDAASYWAHVRAATSGSSSGPVANGTLSSGSTGGGGGANTFWDVPASHPYHDAIQGMADADVINGYNDGSFGPGKLVWRQHFAKMIVGTLGFPCTEADVCPFSDVDAGGPSTLYPDNYIAVVAQYGITKGIGGARFGPYNNITRAQVITMVVRAAQDYMSTLQTPDQAYYAGWGLFRGFQDPTHGYNAQLAEFNGLLTGIQGSGDVGNWIWQPATRGEVAQILWNLSNAGLAG